MNRSRVYVVLLVGMAVGALLGGALAAYATVGGAANASKTATVSVCATKTGAVRGATKKGKCPKGTKRVAINQVGPRGAVGPQGPQGQGGAGATTINRTMDKAADDATEETVYSDDVVTIAARCGVSTVHLILVPAGNSGFAGFGHRYAKEGTSGPGFDTAEAISLEGITTLPAGASERVALDFLLQTLDGSARPAERVSIGINRFAMGSRCLVTGQVIP